MTRSRRATTSSSSPSLSTFAALFGTHQGLPLPPSTVFALQLLLCGVAWTMFLCGVWLGGGDDGRTDPGAPLADG